MLSISAWSYQNFRKLVKQVLYVEEVILTALQFDMTVEHPHPILSRALKRYNKSLSLEQMTALGRSSWQILTDMYASSIMI